MLCCCLCKKSVVDRAEGQDSNEVLLKASVCLCLFLDHFDRKGESVLEVVASCLVERARTAIRCVMDVLPPLGGFVYNSRLISIPPLPACRRTSTRAKYTGTGMCVAIWPSSLLFWETSPRKGNSRESLATCTHAREDDAGVYVVIEHTQ
jgi:hypothetical protein